jgi:hypothetical protein
MQYMGGLPGRLVDETRRTLFKENKKCRTWSTDTVSETKHLFPSPTFPLPSIICTVYSLGAFEFSTGGCGWQEERVVRTPYGLAVIHFPPFCHAQPLLYLYMHFFLGKLQLEQLHTFVDHSSMLKFYAADSDW